MTQDLILLPEPQELTYLNGTLALQPDRFILLNDAVSLHTGRVVQDSLGIYGARWELTTARLDGKHIGATVSIDPAQVPQPEGYTLLIDDSGVHIVGHDAAGAYYGAMTLRQITRQTTPGNLQKMRINDWPDFAHRGVMLDVSRDKVPTIETLHELIEMLAEWKTNELQLYTEHTFAYRNHRIVWEKASPFAGEEILDLDAYCRDRHVDLVPNQNSFGHMTRWLKHAPYNHLAEAPDGYEYPWGGFTPDPMSLNPTDPRSVELMAELFDELLPHFVSGQFNVGCDETWDVGQPGTRSEAAVKEKGGGRVYLDYLLKIYELVKQHGRTMQFWGDIIIKYPELIPELPGDCIALEWGYEADHPFDEHCAAFAKSGIPFYVCPGTSSWNTIAGRTDNALGNIWSAAENGLKHGAIGLLNTDWGDHGHWQPLPVAYLGYAYGAAVSWATEKNRDINLPRALDIHAFHDNAGIMGRLAYDLGNVYQTTGVLLHNTSALHWLLFNADEPLSDRWGAQHVKALQAAADEINKIMLALDTAQMTCPDCDSLMDEFDLAAGLLSHACKLGIARLQAADHATENIPADVRRSLGDELEALITEHRRLWLIRNRTGGLVDSAARLEKLLDLYRA